MRVLFFAQVREATRVAEGELDVADVDASALWNALLQRWPTLAAHRANTRLARNGRYAARDEIFRAGDEVALLPPVSGG